MALGAITSLQGVYTKELVDPKQFGTIFGALQTAIGVGGACGPAIGGVLLDLTGGSTRLLVVPMAVGLLAASLLLALRPRAASRRALPHAITAP